MSQLKALGNEKQREQAKKRGAGENQFGLKMGDIRAVAKKIKTDHALGLQLWKTGNTDAMLLAVLVMKPKELSVAELDKMVRSVTYSWLADWLNSYIVKAHPEKEALRQKWMASNDPSAARAGWSLTAERVAKDPSGLELSALIDRIEAEMATAHPLAQWTMNACLAEIGINDPKLRKRALAIGEKLGVYKDYPVSKGCTSPFAPIWIAEMVKRKG
jgi:3-methyladenine DNA glycosylase AlkD